MSIVDERIVKMVFDNGDFIKNITPTINGLNQLNKATDEVANNAGGGVSQLSNAFKQAEISSTQAGFHVRDVWLKVASILEYQVAGKIVNMGKQIANAMTFEGINDGFKEYELKMGSVQTIMAGTGESLSKVNQYLEELNKYSDQTIYSFADMTNNIGKFTNAGVKLEDAVAAIKGIANEAAISGANANEASRAMYNFSQALSAGYVKLIDWKSIENANMATQGFKDTLLEVASTCGTVEKDSSGMYKVLTKNANGGTMKEMVSATKNFNDSLSQQWMTTEVLTKALKIYATDVLADGVTKAEKEAYEAELQAMGMTDEQIKKFEELGHKATLAASEVKTFSMLIDTLKEAIGSGWAQTFEILIGDFEEAKAVWTAVSNVLGGFIDKQAQARNELLKTWDAMGGRVQVLKSIKNIFDSVMTIAKPIGQAMKQVFPPVTADNLLAITKGLKQFTIEMTKVSEEIAPKVASAAKGVFAIIHMGMTLVSAFVKDILPAGKVLGTLATYLLDAAANAGEFIAKIDRVITQAKVFETVFAIIGMVLQKPINFLKQHIGDISTILTTVTKVATTAFKLIGTGMSGIITVLSALVNGLKSGAGSIENLGKPVKTVFDDINGGLDNVQKKIDHIKPIFEGFGNLLAGIGKFIGTIFRQMGESISGASFGGNGISGFMNIVNALVSGGILYSLYNGIKQFSKIGDSINGLFEGLGDALGSFGKKIESETLINIAKAIAILAGSLFLVAMIDSDKLTGATVAISAMVGVMAGAMAALMKAINSFSTTDVTKTFSIFGKDLFGTNATKMLELSVTLKAVSKALIAMGAAVLLMSIGLKVVSGAAKDGHLWDSFAVISLMLAELTAVGIVLSKFGGDKAVKGLTSMSTALIIMAAALKVISNVVAGGNAWQSLGILSIILAELTGVALLVQNFGKHKMTGMASLISLAVSLNICVIALKSVSDALGTEGNKIWQALGVISIMLAELAAVTILMSKFAGFAALGGAGAILAATSLLIMVQALKQISDALGKSDQHIWQALGVIAASLLVLAVGLTAMAGTIPGAAGLLVASAALIILGGALKIIGSLKLSEIGKSLLAIAGSLIILAVGLTAMVAAIPGAIALTIAASALTVLGGALKIFGSMKLGEIAKSLGVLALGLAGIAIIGTVLSVATPFLLAFSGALLVFGAAITVGGVGLTIFASGLQALVAVVPMGTAAMKALLTTMIELIPVLVGALLDALGTLATKIATYAPQFAQAIVAILDLILTVIVDSSLKIGEAVYKVIEGTMTIIAENIPIIAEKAADIIMAFLEAISTQIPRIVDKGYECAIALINGIADAIDKNNSNLIAAIDRLMTSIGKAILQWIVGLTPIGLLIPEEIKEGIMSGEFDLKSAVGDLIKGAIDGIKEKISDFKQAAEYLIGGFIEGLKGTWAGKAISAAVEFGGKVVDGLNSKKGLDEHSNSKKTIKSGEYFVGGLQEGIENGSGDVIDTAALLGDDTTNALNDTLTDGSDDIMGTINTLLDNIKGACKETDQYTNSMKKNAISAQKQAQMLELVTEETESHMTAEEKAAEATRKKTKETKANTEAQDANTTSTGKGTAATKKQADVTEYASGILEAFTENYGHLYKSIGDDAPIKVGTLAIKKLAEATYEASLKAKEATETNEKTTASIEDMIKAFTEMKTKIYDSVKSMFEGDNFFQKFELKAEKSMGELLEAMRSNVDGVMTWSSKLVELGNKGLDQGLLRQLAELGPKGYEYVNAFSNATVEEIQEANSLFAQAAVLPDQVSNSAIASYAQAGLNVVQGFVNGIDNNVALASISAENLGLTTLASLQAALQEQSPSQATREDGVYLVLGLRNGINETKDLALRAASVMCIEIVSKIKTALDYDEFFALGQSIAFGLAAGMSSEEAIQAVTSAAEALCAIAETVTAKYNKIASPSKLYKKYGGYIAEGLAIGMENGASYVENGAKALSDAVHRTMETVNQITEDEMNLHPVIEPVLDISNLKNKANAIGNLFPARSIGLASSIGRGSGYISDGGSGKSNYVPNQINFTQNNYSPKALSRIEIYRQTKNQISMMKGAVAR